MIESATGLVLRTRLFTETSLIVHWLTAGSGRIATIAKGARRPRSPFLGKLDLFYEAELSFSRSARSQLHALREVGLRETHAPLRREMGRLNQASYCAALIEQCTETDTPLPSVYELMRGLLAALSDRPARPQFVFSFELKLLNELGLKPDFSRGNLTAGARRIISALMNGDWGTASGLKLSPAQVRELDQFLRGFLIFHLGGIPKARNGAIDL